MIDVLLAHSCDVIGDVFAAAESTEKRLYGYHIEPVHVRAAIIH
jgi:hypothetical protein